MKQTTLGDWFKKRSQEKAHRIMEPQKSIMRLILDIGSSVEEYKDIIAEVEDNKIALYIKQKHIPIYIAKLTKEKFLEMCQLDDDLSPAKVKAILPDLDDALILTLCQFLLSQRRKKIQDSKADLFSF